MNSLLVERTLGLAQLQDAGRFGIRHLGVTQGGALDWIAMHWANWMLGNALDSPVIEIPLGGLTLQARSDMTLALTGADLAATLDAQPIAPWQSFQVRAGQRLSFNPPRHGVRAYLAGPGGFSAPKVLGSSSTVLREGLGGLDGSGKALQAGDELTCEALGAAPRPMPAAKIPDYQSPASLQLLLGSQDAQFAGQSLFQLFNSAWQVDQRADRMGIRLLGPALRYHGQPLVSEGIPLGAIQVPPDGQPIVLMNDRQTIGGYPRLGALTPVSVARLAQCAAGSTLRMTPIGAERARQEHLQLLRTWADL